MDRQQMGVCPLRGRFSNAYFPFIEAEPAPLAVRSFDPARVNALVNDPTIRPTIGGDGKSILDLSDAVASTINCALLGKHGGGLFIWCAPGVYEVHTFILPEGRREWSFAFAAACMDDMRKRGANHVWSRVDPAAANAETTRRFALKQGFVPAGQLTSDLGHGPITYDILEWRA